LKEELCLGSVMSLLVQDTNGAAQSVDGLGVIRDSCLEINSFLLANCRSCFLILGPSVNVLVKLLDAISELPDLHSVLLKLSCEFLNLCLSSINLILLCAQGVLAPLIKCGELHFFVLLCCDPLVVHLLHHLKHLLDWCNTMGHRQPSEHECGLHSSEECGLRWSKLT
jgi:hypothetical protein